MIQEIIYGPQQGEHENPVTVNQAQYREKIITPYLRLYRVRALPHRKQWFPCRVGILATQRRKPHCFRGTGFPYPFHSPEIYPPYFKRAVIGLVFHYLVWR